MSSQGVVCDLTRFVFLFTYLFVILLFYFSLKYIFVKIEILKNATWTVL